jgi:hypothetical protein
MAARYPSGVWRKRGAWLAVVIGIALHAGCKTSSTRQSGVSSIQPVDSGPVAAQIGSKTLSAQPMNVPSGGVIPASYTQPWTDPASGGDCSH